MKTLAETEMIRARWRRHLAAEALDTAARSDFSPGGLGSRVAEPTAKLLLLPSEPDSTEVEFDGQFWEWIEAHKTIEVGNGRVSFGSQIRPTAHAAAIFDESSDAKLWKNYAAVHRNGAVEMTLGTLGGKTHSEDPGRSPHRFWLAGIVARAWGMLELFRTLPNRIDDVPLLLAVALRDTKGAMLADFGMGCPDPQYQLYDRGGCPDDNLLWHIQIDQMSDDAPATQEVAFSVGDRIENAWGCRQKLYLDHTGDLAGKLNVRRV